MIWKIGASAIIVVLAALAAYVTHATQTSDTLGETIAIGLAVLLTGLYVLHAVMRGHWKNL